MKKVSIWAYVTLGDDPLDPKVDDARVLYALEGVFFRSKMTKNTYKINPSSRD